MRVLVVEDERDMNLLIQKVLKKSGCSVDGCFDGQEAEDYLAGTEYDVILLDVMLPKRDGYQLVADLRDRGVDTPVLFLTARGEDEDRIRGLGLGADDYMVKPFLPKELLLRIGIILRRYYKAEDPAVELAGCRIDLARAEVVKNGEHLPLTAKEHEILSVLYRNAGRIVTIDQLCEAAWGENPFGYENSLMAHIRRIREKIEANPSKPVSLITVRGLGYKLVLEGRR